MPRLIKGGKWVYGWVLVGPAGKIPIPPEAWQEYEFQSGHEALFVAGSRTSRGLVIATTALWETRKSARGVQFRVLGRGRFGDGWVQLPSEVGISPGECLLVVRGSRLGLSLVGAGPILEEGLKYPELEVFGAAADHA
jgi:hypothetical protein